ncbi:MAG: SMC-Scp complex subunit ScpB [Porticoccus sp.]
MESDQLRKILEGALLAAGRSLDIGHLEKLFDEFQVPPRDQILAALEEIEADCSGRGFELKRTGSGYRFQVRQELSEWVNRLWEEKPKKYSRALLETLALIAYRQPITRGDIEEIRGVSVSSEIIKTLLEREWARVVGHRDVPGRPALYATTRQFLDYFSLKNLEELPTLNDIRDIEEINPELALELAQKMAGEEAQVTSDVQGELSETEEQGELVSVDERVSSETTDSDLDDNPKAPETHEENL